MRRSSWSLGRLFSDLGLKLKSKKQRRGVRSQKRRTFSLEPLEERALLSVCLWTGGGGNAYWNTANNWDRDGQHVVPQQGDVLKFAGTQQISTQNDITGRSFASIEFADSSFTLAGIPITLTSGVTVDPGAASETISLNMALSGAIAVNVATASSLTDSGVLFRKRQPHEDWCGGVDSHWHKHVFRRNNGQRRRARGRRSGGCALRFRRRQCFGERRLPVCPSFILLRRTQRLAGQLAGWTTKFPGGQPTSAMHTYPDGTQSFAIAVTATDGNNHTATVTLPVTVENVAPMVNLTGNRNVDEGSTYTLSLSATDPGNDTISGWTINWGDGDVQPISGNPSSVGHVYADNGNYNITATVTDGNGTFATTSTAGDLDTTFGSAGKVTANVVSGSSDIGYAVAAQSDGKIVVAGSSNGNIFVARYLSDGSLDPTFGTNGIVTTDLGGTDYAYGVAIQSDGKIVVAGQTGTDFALVRYNTDGSLDTTFGSNGWTTTDFGGTDCAYGVAMQSDGKIVVAGCSGSSFALRVTPRPAELTARLAQTARRRQGSEPCLPIGTARIRLQFSRTAISSRRVRAAVISP